MRQKHPVRHLIHVERGDKIIVGRDRETCFQAIRRAIYDLHGIVDVPGLNDVNFVCPPVNGNLPARRIHHADFGVCIAIDDGHARFD